MAEIGSRPEFRFNFWSRRVGSLAPLVGLDLVRKNVIHIRLCLPGIAITIYTVFVLSVGVVIRALVIVQTVCHILVASDSVLVILQISDISLRLACLTNWLAARSSALIQRT